MTSRRADRFPVLEPSLQVSFYYRLESIRELYLFEALKKTVQEADIQELDKKLAHYVDSKNLKQVASFGLRGEVFFPVPYIIEANPLLLGYYRLLFGLSQKAFYNKGPFGRFKRLEEVGDLPVRLQREIEPLCMSLIETAKLLVGGLDILSLTIVNDLQLLTIGAQLRGSENTRLGQDATKDVFGIFRNIVSPYIKDETKRTILLKNDSGRNVLIEFASDPDIRITEKLKTHIRPLVSIEIKGGTDASNIHNRLGEAEKSHQKAKKRGFFEFWTIIRVDVDQTLAKQESPTTSRLFHLDRLLDSRTKDYKMFRDMLGSIIGIRI